MATCRNWSSSTKEHSNFARLCRLLINGGTLVLKEVFDSIHPPTTLHGVLNSPTVKKSLKAKRVLNKHQWDKLYPSNGTSVTSSSFDITLLFLLLRHICGLTAPATGWDNPPADTDTSREADLARIKLYRNQLYGHITTTSISDDGFEKYWNEIEGLLLRLSASRYEEEIKRLKIETMEPEDEKLFVKAIEEWEQLGQQILSKLKEVIDRLLKPSSNVVADQSRCQDYTKKLKSSVNSHTDYQPGLKENKPVETDDIFTNLTIQRGQKHLKKHLAKERPMRNQFEPDSSRGRTVLKKCSELFTFPVDSDAQVSRDARRQTYPRSILVIGQAGIGKTLLSQKLVRDWANDRLFDEEMPEHPDFQFVFLLTFRQLNLLGRKKLNLRELLNRSSLLNEQSTLDDAVFEYLLQNPEKMLLIIDGYDEYLHHKKVKQDYEAKYPNDPRVEMPVPVVVAKLVKEKMLQESVVMITSRPEGKVQYLKDSFDVQVEVTGFSSSQVLDYVEKYFKDNESMKNTVLDHFRQHENLLELVHVPVICWLMCYVLEWHLTDSESPENPLTVTRTTDLYDEVIKVFIRKHHLLLKYADEEEADRNFKKILNKLAKLAAKLLDKKKYIFDEKDLSKLGFGEEEKEILKGSGVLYCCPGTRDSPFGKVPDEYSFIHLTVQEYLAAYWFVEQKRIPKNGSPVVLQFMSGILARKKDDEWMMIELLDSIDGEGKDPKDQEFRKVLKASCVYEYGDMEFAKKFIIDHDEYVDDNRWIRITDMNSVFSITFLLDVITLLNEEQAKRYPSPPSSAKSFYVESFSVAFSHLSAVGVKRIARSVSNVSCTVTRLGLTVCKLDDGCVQALTETLVLGKLIDLDLDSNYITDKGVASICEALKSEHCKLTSLNLDKNKITDDGVASICEALKSEHCKLTSLNLDKNKITDDGVASICEALKSEHCKLTSLNLDKNKITDDRVASICEALKSEHCKLTSLNLDKNKITDDRVASICEALKSEHCKLTSLDVSRNGITDHGVASICKALKSEHCKLNSLDLGANKITDDGVASICEALKSEHCKLTSLDVGKNEITDDGVASICEALKSEHCKLTSLDVSRNEITDDGLASICEALKSEHCKLTSLDVYRNEITDDGLASICEALKKKNTQIPLP